MSTSDLGAILRAQEWDKIRRQLTEFARRRTARIQDAEDAAMTAIMQVYDPRYVRWDPAKETLMQHLASVVNGILVNRRRKRTSRELGQDPEDLESMHTHANTAESKLIEEESKARFFDELRETVAGDEVACGIVDLMREEVATARDQQKRLGCPIERIYSARRRIDAHIEKIANRAGDDDV